MQLAYALASRVCAALRAAAERRAGPFVCAARFADCERAPGERRFAAACACFDSDAGDAAACPSRLSALRVARERRDEDFRLAAAPWPRA